MLQRQHAAFSPIQPMQRSHSSADERPPSPQHRSPRSPSPVQRHCPAQTPAPLTHLHMKSMSRSQTRIMLSRAPLSRIMPTDSRHRTLPRWPRSTRTSSSVSADQTAQVRRRRGRAAVSRCEDSDEGRKAGASEGLQRTAAGWLGVARQGGSSHGLPATGTAALSAMHAMQGGSERPPRGAFPRPLRAPLSQLMGHPPRTMASPPALHTYLLPHSTSALTQPTWLLQGGVITSAGITSARPASSAPSCGGQGQPGVRPLSWAACSFSAGHTSAAARPAASASRCCTPGGLPAAPQVGKFSVLSSPA